MVVETGEIDAGATARPPGIELLSGQSFVNLPNPPVEAFSQGPSSETLSLVPPDDTCRGDYYEIEGSQQSECALVLFTRHMLTSERVVMKVLSRYKDTRYSLETVSERQQCQLEALQRNRVFAPEVYIGLARIHELDLCRECILIDDVVRYPSKEMFDPGVEYALIMRPLPEERHLDRLLKEESKEALADYMHLLSRYVAHVHTNLDVGAGERQWGSYEQLQRKLIHNLDLLDLVVLDKSALYTASENGRYDAYNPLEDRLTSLKSTLYHIFTQNHYRQYFEQRVTEHCIKHCHGDLKAPHIWIAPRDSWCEQELWKSVSVLDAADFNPSYTHIDVLSDLALLAIDIQARTQSSSLADLLMERYLQYTKQQEEVARAVLAYYLVEKAIVGTAISIAYDHVPDLGWAYLAVAEMRLKSLVEMQY